jgi:hypothetical protein
VEHDDPPPSPIEQRPPGVGVAGGEIASASGVVEVGSAWLGAVHAVLPAALGPERLQARWGVTTPAPERR